jgi:hypothetical protein
MAFNWYPSQAKDKEGVIQAIQKKQKELLNEMSFYEAGLRKIEGLEEEALYDLTLENKHYLVQCKQFRRDTVHFRILASDLPQFEVRNLLGDMITLSYTWNQGWETTPITDPKQALTFIGCPWKTLYFEKLLKGELKYGKKSKTNLNRRNESPYLADH